MTRDFDVVSTALDAGLYIEASAGTGKTWSVAALVAREIARRDDLSIGDILITTFTRNAAAELRDRVRRRLVDTAAALANPPGADDDVLVASLRSDDAVETAARIARLQRASVEFDTAMISTIHSVCSRILALAGLASAASDDDVEKRIVAEKVNDFVVAEAVAGRVWESRRLAAAVHATLGAPDAEAWLDPSLDAEHRDRGEAARRAVTRIVDEVRRAMVLTPTFDDLVRRAGEVVSDDAHSEAQRAIGERFRLVLIDEAQDTDPAQWRVFRGIVAASGVAAMVVVGDPKQSIYRFRGADINAYQRNRREDLVSTLGVNRRSDTALIDALNHLLAGTSYGPGIDYRNVSAPSGAPNTALVSGPAPLEIVTMPDATNLSHMCAVAAARVVELLSSARYMDRHGTLLDLSPSDVCVLVGSNAAGRMIENRLRNLGVPAVSGGTGSVTDGETAADLRAILRACAQPSHPGRVRRAAATMFLGGSLLGPGILDDELLEDMSDKIHGLARALRRSGVPAFATELMSLATASGVMLASRRAERRMTDFRHLMELLDGSVGATEPHDVLEKLASLDALDPRADTVSRRVESDADAVTIMTIHAAKGLEFPFVVVADMVKAPSSRRQDAPIIATLPGREGRIIDVAWAHPAMGDAPEALHADRLAEEHEIARRFYVALTRARHHLSVLYAPHAKGSLFADLIAPGVLERPHPVLRVVTGVGTASPLPPSTDSMSRHVAPCAVQPRRTYRRTSFTGIVSEVEGANRLMGDFAVSGSGHDEDTGFIDPVDISEQRDRPVGANMPLAHVPAGADIGTVIHSIYEDIDTSAQSLRAEVERCVDRHATGPRLREWRKELIEGIEQSMLTGLGEFMGGACLADIAPSDRLAEVSFEMGLAHLNRGVTASAIGRVLRDMLPSDDPLYPYATELTGRAFDAVPLAGLVNGSIDALLRINVDNEPRLFITDYKSNRLGTDADPTHISAYAPHRLIDAMTAHHYPLQALIYGAAVHRFLRWRAPDRDADVTIGGVAYFFVRGMTADPSLVEDGIPYGVFQWRAPHGLWRALSDAMSGVSVP